MHKHRLKYAMWAAFSLIVLLTNGGQAASKPQHGGGFKPARKAPAEQPTWSTVDLKLERTLTTTDLGDLAVSLARAKPTRDPEQLMLRLNVFLRAGDRKLANEVVRSFKGTAISRKVYYGIPDALIKSGEFSIAGMFMESYPCGRIYCLSEFLRHLKLVTPAVDPDKWLAARSHEDSWVLERLKYRMTLGTQKDILDSLTTDIRQHPHDIHRVKLFLEAESEAQSYPNIDWLPNVCSFPLSIQNQELAERLESAYPTLAVPFLERSIAMPLTPPDFRYLRSKAAGMLGASGFPDEKGLRAEQKTRLMMLYQRFGQNDKALKLIAELSADNPNGLPIGLGGFAGQGQAATGTRVFENRIVAAEKDNKDSDEYWITRAAYYCGRKENEKANDAFLKALEITLKSGDTSGRRFDDAHQYISFLNSTEGYAAASKWVYTELNRPALPTAYADAMAKELQNLAHDYVQVLVAAHKSDEAAKWLHDRLAAAPPTGANSDKIVWEILDLARNTNTQVDASDELLWRYVAANAEWTHGEQGLLTYMYWQLTGAALEALLTRIEKLAENGAPSRAKVVGDILQNLRRTERAIPWYEIAVRGLPKGTERSTTAYYLFGIYSARNRWRDAEALLPEMTLSHDEYLGSISTLATSAVRAGSAEEAMRLFRLVVNDNRRLNSRGGRLMRVLADYGVKEQLVQFYQQMAKQDPNSVEPQEALAELAR